jgi:hypothetical protein
MSRKNRGWDYSMFGGISRWAPVWWGWTSMGFWSCFWLGLDNNLISYRCIASVLETGVWCWLTVSMNSCWKAYSAFQRECLGFRVEHLRFRVRKYLRSNIVHFAHFMRFSDLIKARGWVDQSKTEKGGGLEASSTAETYNWSLASSIEPKQIPLMDWRSPFSRLHPRNRPFSCYMPWNTRILLVNRTTLSWIYYCGTQKNFAA